MKRSKLILGTVGLIVLSVLLSGCLGLFGPKVGQVTGKVTYKDNGEAIAEATVTVGDKSTKTSASGTYTIADIPQGTQKLEVTVNGEVVHSSQVQVSKVPLTKNVEVERKKATITGTVKDSAADPVKDAIVRLPDLSLDATTNDSGAFSIANVIFGTHTYTVTHEGNVVSTGSVLIDKENVSLNITLPAAISFAAVSGTVKDGEGDPVDGAVVAISGVSLSTSTDAAGTFSFAKVLYGNYRLTVTVDGETLYDEALAVDQPLIDDLDIEVTIPTPLACGPGSNPPAGMKLVYCADFAEANSLADAGFAVGSGTWKIVDADGKRWIEGLGDASRWAYAEVPEMANANKVVVEYTGMYTSDANTWGLQFLSDRPDQAHGTNFMLLSAWNGLYFRRYTNNSAVAASTVISSPKIDKGVSVTVRATYDYTAKTVNILRNGAQAANFPHTIPDEYLVKGSENKYIKLFLNYVDGTGNTTARWTDIRVWVD